jgi:hypothetical protein
MNTNSASNVCWKNSKQIIQPLEQDIGKCSRRTIMNLNIKELVLMMHFGFIDKFRKGWNHIYKGWLDKLKQHLKNAGNRLIKQICLKQLTSILNLDSLVKKIPQPTK